MNKKNNIFEELSRIQSLVNYRRGKVISEQDPLTGIDALFGTNMSGYNSKKNPPVAATPPAAPPKTAASQPAKDGWWNQHPTLVDYIEKGSSHAFPSNADGHVRRTMDSDPKKWFAFYSTGEFQGFDKLEDVGKYYLNPYNGKWDDDAGEITVTLDNGQSLKISKGGVTTDWTDIPKGKSVENKSKESNSTADDLSNNKPKQSTVATELKDVDGVKKFQDWLDQNKTDVQLGDGKGWATGYTGGALNKGNGYGNFGPRTTKAWSQYKSEYLGGGNGTDIDLSSQLSGLDLGALNKLYGANYTLPNVDVQNTQTTTPDTEKTPTPTTTPVTNNQSTSQVGDDKI